MTEEQRPDLKILEGISDHDLVRVLRDRLPRISAETAAGRDLIDQIFSLNAAAQSLLTVEPSSSPETAVDYFAQRLQETETFALEGYSNWQDWLVDGEPLVQRYQMGGGSGISYFGPKGRTFYENARELVTPSSYFYGATRDFPWRQFGVELGGTSSRGKVNVIMVNYPQRVEDVQSYQKPFVEKLPSDEPFCGISYIFCIDNYDSATVPRQLPDAHFSFLLPKSDTDKFVRELEKDPALGDKLIDHLYPGLDSPDQMRRVKKDKLFLFDRSNLPKNTRLHERFTEPIAKVLAYP